MTRSRITRPTRRTVGTAVAVVPQYDSVTDAIRKPTRTVGLSEYFFTKWWPLLGDRYARIILQLRMVAQQNDQHDWVQGQPFSAVAVTYDALAALTQIPTRSLKRLLSADALAQHVHAARFLKVENCYEYHADTGRRVRGANRYFVRVLDPLTPEDELRATSRDPGLAVIPGDGSPEGEVDKAKALLARLAAELPDLNRATAMRLIQDVGADEVEQQLAWLKYRDISGFRNGKVAAFVVFCGDRRAKPKRLERQEERAMARNSAPQEAPEWTPPPVVHPILAGMPDSRRRALAPMVREVTVSEGSITIWCTTSGELALLKSYKDDLAGAAIANLGRAVEVRFAAAEQEST